jgi:hypothetical protein
MAFMTAKQCWLEFWWLNNRTEVMAPVDEIDNRLPPLSRDISTPDLGLLAGALFGKCAAFIGPNVALCGPLPR